MLHPFNVMMALLVVFLIFADEVPFWKILAIVYVGIVCLLGFVIQVPGVVVVVMAAVFVIVNAFYWLVQQAFNR